MRMLTTEERRLLLLPEYTDDEPPMASDSELAIAKELIKVGRADLVKGRYFMRNHWGWKALRIDDIIRSML